MSRHYSKIAMNQGAVCPRRRALPDPRRSGPHRRTGPPARADLEILHQVGRRSRRGLADTACPRWAKHSRASARNSARMCWPTKRDYLLLLEQRGGTGGPVGGSARGDGSRCRGNSATPANTSVTLSRILIISRSSSRSCHPANAAICARPRSGPGRRAAAKGGVTDNAALISEIIALRTREGHAAWAMTATPPYKA